MVEAPAGINRHRCRSCELVWNCRGKWCKAVQWAGSQGIRAFFFSMGTGEKRETWNVKKKKVRSVITSQQNVEIRHLTQAWPFFPFFFSKKGRVGPLPFKDFLAESNCLPVLACTGSRVAKVSGGISRVARVSRRKHRTKRLTEFSSRFRRPPLQAKRQPSCIALALTALDAQR